MTIFPDGRVLMGPGPVRNFDLRANGDLHIAGALFESSDKNLKTEFAAVDIGDVLRKVSELPITTWRYKSDDEGQRHMGPTAQDFRAAFGLGESEKTIATLDSTGVALAAIKALHSQATEKGAEIVQLKETVREQQNLIDEQQQMLEEIAMRMESLESALSAAGSN